MAVSPWRALLLGVCGLSLVAAVAPPAAQAAVVEQESAVSSVRQGSWQFNGRVRASVIVGRTVYVGGEFTAAVPPAGSADATPVPRAYLAAVDLVSGELLPWDPEANGRVWALAASQDGSKVFAGGDFTTVGGASRSRVAALTPEGGRAVSSWNPGAVGRVRAIEVDAQHVYLGGQFTKLANRGPGRMGRVSVATGALDTAWRVQVTQFKAGEHDPSTGAPAQCPPRCTPAVTALALSTSGDLYLGGHFGKVNGAVRNQGAQVSAGTGAVLDWHPDVFVGDPNNPNQKNYIYDIAVSPASSSHPDRVFVCGDFYQAGGSTSPNVAATHAVTGRFDTRWRGTTDGGTPACVLGPGDALYLGGHFRLVGGRRAKLDGLLRNHVAALPASDPELQPSSPSGTNPCYCVYPTTWDPNVNSALGVHTMATDGSRVAIGGDFTKVNGGKYVQRGLSLYSPNVPVA